MAQKLLFITHQLSKTGAPIVLLDMIRICRQAGAQVDLISLLDGELREELRAMDIPVTIEDEIFKKRNTFYDLANTYDMVIANTLLAYQVIHVLNGAPVPVIWWLHEGEQYFEYFKTVLPDIKSLHANIRTYAVSHYVQDIVRRRFGCELPILHFGVREKARQSAPSPSFWNTPDPKHQRVRFLTAGTYSQVKAQDILVKAIRMLPGALQDQCCFLFCGNEQTFDPDIFVPVQKLCEESSCSYHLPAQQHDALMQLMEEADFLIVPSRVDPVPAIAAEAMMQKKPCLITDVCGAARYLKHGVNAFLFSSDDAASLCKMIGQAVRLYGNESAYQRMCSRSQDVYAAHFSFDVFALKVKELLLCDRPCLIFMTGVYDILDIFTYELIPAFRQLGYETMEFDSSDMQKSLAKLSEFIKKPVTAVITFNNLGFNMELVEGKNIWDELGIYCINILMDHPFCHKPALDAAPAHAIVLCPDKNHMRYLERFYPQLPITGFLPHAGKDLHIRPKPIADRTTDVIYTGGLSKSFAARMMPDFSQFSFDARKIADTAYEDLIRHPRKTTEQAIEEALLSSHIYLSNENLCDFIEKIHYIDLLAVSWYREMAVRLLVEAGISVTLYGTGWDGCEWLSAPNLHFGGRISADAAVEEMQNAKIVLSTMTWFKDGTHDRVFNGMLAGAVALTDSSVYMRETFCGDIDDPAAELIMFELEEISALPQTVKALLADSKRMQQIADNGRKKALAGHTWQTRAQELHDDLLLQLQE